jgi:hypothetical protein
MRKTIDKIRLFFATRKFPVLVKDKWFAYQALNAHEGKRQLPPYWDEDGKYIDYSIGDIVPLYSKNGFLAFYKITGWHCYSGSDPATWDDKREYNLRLHHIKHDTPEPVGGEE